MGRRGDRLKSLRDGSISIGAHTCVTWTLVSDALEPIWTRKTELAEEKSNIEDEIMCDSREQVTEASPSSPQRGLPHNRGGRLRRQSKGLFTLLYFYYLLFVFLSNTDSLTLLGYICSLFKHFPVRDF